MKFGLTPEQYTLVVETVVRPLEALGASVWCYGSRARGDHQKFSDLDLMVESSIPVSKFVSQIQEQLMNSHFPLKVDLVEYCHFAESYKSGYLKDRVRFSSLNSGELN